MMTEVNLLNVVLLEGAWFAGVPGCANAGNIRQAMGRGVDSRV